MMWENWIIFCLTIELVVSEQQELKNLQSDDLVWKQNRGRNLIALSGKQRLELGKGKVQVRKQAFDRICTKVSNTQSHASQLIGMKRNEFESERETYAPILHRSQFLFFPFQVLLFVTDCCLFSGLGWGSAIQNFLSDPLLASPTPHW